MGTITETLNALADQLGDEAEAARLDAVSRTEDDPFRRTAWNLNERRIAQRAAVRATIVVLAEREMS